MNIIIEESTKLKRHKKREYNIIKYIYMKQQKRMPCDRNLTSNNKKTQGKSEHLRDRGCDDPVAFVER